MDDMISRQSVLYTINKTYEDTVKGIDRHSSVHGLISAVTGIYKNTICLLPSAQPYTIHSDGRLWVTVDNIDKVNAVVVDEHKSKFCKQFYLDAEHERKKGKWIHISEEMWKCDQCGEISCCSPNFCPDCGSDMRQRGEQNG